MKARKVYEAIEFERGKDPKKSIGVGKYKDFYGKSADDIARIIIKDVEQYVDPLFSDLSDLVKNKGYDGIEHYQETIWDDEEMEPLHDKEDPDIEAFIQDILEKTGDYVKEKYPVKTERKSDRHLMPEDAIAAEIIGSQIGGAPFGSMVNLISSYLDTSLFESLEFERRKDPKSTLGIGKIAELEKGLKRFKEDKSSTYYAYFHIESNGEKFVVYASGDANSKEMVDYHLAKSGISNYFNLRNTRTKKYRYTRTIEYPVKKEYQELFKILADRGSIGESLEFERGKDPKEAMKIGLPKEFDTPEDAAEWATNNLHLISNYKYKEGDVIRPSGYNKIPEDLREDIQKWAKTISIGGKKDLESNLVNYAYFLRDFLTLLKFKGKLKEPWEGE